MKNLKWVYEILFAILTLIVMSCTKSMELTQSAPTNVHTLKSLVVLPDVQISSVTLFAGQTMNAGTVSIYQTDTNGDHIYDAFKIVYTLANGWQFTDGEAVKFYLGTAIPTDDTPGQFAYHYTPGAGTTTFTVTFPFGTFGFDGCTALTLYIAAHADLIKGTDTETGWGNGTKFSEHGWSMYFSFNLSDKTPPTASNVTSNFECMSDVPAETPAVIKDAADNCGVPTVAFVSENNDGKTCPTTITRTYSVTDAAGNSINVTYTITVHDDIAPVLTGQGANATIGCSETPSFTAPMVTDNCDANPILTSADTVQTVGYLTSTTRTWTATDACGNTSSVSQTIINNCTPNPPPTDGWVAGSGTGWAYNGDLSTAFNSITNKTSNNWGWTNKLTFGSHQVFTLYVGAGQNIISKGEPVGSVTVDYTASNIIVKYEVISLCNITDAHVWVGKTPLPLNKQNAYISAPGQLGYNSGVVNSNTYTFTIPNKFGTSDIYVAAHADIVVK